MTKKAWLQQLFAVLLIGIGGAIICWPLTHDGLFTAHDIWHQVARLYHYHQLVSNGIFPPGWVMTLSHNFGYPLFYFSYHLPWMIGELLLRMGVPLFIALKVLFAFGFISSGFAMYWLLWEVTNNKIGSVVGSLVYIFAPYHILTIYVAAAIGSVFQFVFMPLLLLGPVLILKEKKILGCCLFASAIAGSILSHLMSTVMFLPFIGLWIVVYSAVIVRTQWRKWMELIQLMLVAGLLGLGLAAFYLVPLIILKPAIIADSAGGFRDLYRSHFVAPKQLLYSPWGFGPIVSNAKDGEISLQVGIAQWVGLLALKLAILTIALSAISNTVKKWKLPITFSKSVFAATIATISSFLLVLIGMLEQSAPVWRFLNQYMTLDYPWRLLLLAVVFGSVGCGLVISTISNQRLSVVLSLLLIVIAMYTNRNHIRVNLYTHEPLHIYIESEVTTNTFAEYLPKGASESVMKPFKPFVVSHSLIETNLSTSAARLLATVDVPQDDYYSLRHFSFPTMKVLVDNVPTAYEKDQNGLLRVALVKGKHVIEIRAEALPIMNAGFLISLISAFILAAISVSGILKTIRKNHAAKKI